MTRLGVLVSVVLYILMLGTPKKRIRYSGFCVLYNIICRGLGWGVGFVVLVAGCFGFGVPACRLDCYCQLLAEEVFSRWGVFLRH